VNSICFEDHDETFAFEQNIYLEKKFMVSGDKNSMHISKSIEGLFNPLYNLYDLKIIGLPFKPLKILIDGVEIQESFVFDESKQFRIKCQKNFTRIDISS
jgi:alpha-glucosidase